MKGWWSVLIIVMLLIVAAAVALVFIPAPAKAPAVDNLPDIADLISVSQPVPGASISSPLAVTGSARGTWYFEASFPVKLIDESGKVIIQTPAQAQGDWMTTDFVPFAAILTFAPQPAGSHGTLVLKNDNPSGDPSRDKALEIPVVFK
jgi:hypothetical protein